MASLVPLFYHLLPRRDACQILHFQTERWMLFKDSRNPNKMAAVDTIHTSVIRFFNCLYLLNLTINNYWRWRADVFSASQIDCTPPDSPMLAGKHRTSTSCFFNRQLVSLATSPATPLTNGSHDLLLRLQFVVISVDRGTYLQCIKRLNHIT